MKVKMRRRKDIVEVSNSKVEEELGLAEDRRRVLGFPSPWHVFVASKPV